MGRAVDYHDVRKNKEGHSAGINTGPYTDPRTGDKTSRIIEYNDLVGDPWLLSLIGDPAYSLGTGDIMHQLSNVPGIAGVIENAIEATGEKLGLNVMGRPKRESEVETDSRNYNVVFDRMQHNAALRYGAYALFLGHRAAIREAQTVNKHGSALFNSALNEWEFTSPIGMTAALEVLHDLMPEELKVRLKRMQDRNPKLQSFSTTPNPNDHKITLFLTSPNELLFPALFDKTSSPPTGLTRPIPKPMIDIFAHFTMQRIDATFRPQPISNTLPQHI